MKRDMPAAELIRQYDRLAERYDRRWQVYLKQTLGHALEMVQVSGTGCILDVGCGTGEFARMVSERFPRLTIVGIDATPAMVERASAKLRDCPRVAFQIGWAEALPFAQERFDAVVCANVLHYLRDPHQALQECTRVLRPGGQVIVVDWCRDFWHCRLMHWWLKAVDRAYVRMHRLADVTAMLEELGLTVTTASRFMVPPAYGMMQIAAQKLVWVPT